MWAHLRIQNTGTRMTRIELISLIKPGKTVKGYPISIKTLTHIAAFAPSIVKFLFF